MSQLMPLPLTLTVSCFSKIQIGFTFLVPAHLFIPRKRAVKRVCVLLATLYDHMFVGLLGHSAVVFHVFMFFSCFYVLLTVCVAVFYQ